MSSNNAGQLITKIITTLQHFATLHHTTPHYTYRHFTSSHLHFTTLSFGVTHFHFLSFCVTSLHITKLDTVHSSHLQTYFQNSEPLHCPKEPFTTSLFIFYILFFFYLSDQPVTSHFFAIHIYNSLHLLSVFTFYRLHFPSLVFTFLTLVLKTGVLPWEVPIAPSGSLFQSVMDLFTKEYFPMSVLCFLALIFQ
jgi:hypothetical protein